MANKIDEIIAFLATKEMPAATAEGTAAENPKVLLEEIEKHMAEIQQLFISSFQLQCLSSGAINSAPVFAALSNLQSRLMALVTPYADSAETEIKYIRDRISRLAPRIGQEGKYIYETTTLDSWNSIISQRISIPQGFVGVINVASLAAVTVPSAALAAPPPLDTDAEVSGGLIGSAARSTGIEYSLRKFTFLATHGIGPCVGFLLYSEAAQRLALAHFDDPFSATRSKPDPEKLSAAQFHYQACIKGILTQAQAGLDHDPDDWKVILAPSGMEESKALSKILSVVCLSSTIEGKNITTSEWGSAGEAGRSILIDLRQFNMRVLLDYKESVDIAAFPKRRLNVRQALNLPTAGLSLFRMARGLIPCNPEQGCYIENDYVTTVEPNISLANRYFVATCSSDPIPVALQEQLDTVIAALVAATSGPAATGTSSGQTTKADAPALLGAASAVRQSAFLPEHGGLGLDVARRAVEDEHPLLTAARCGSAPELEATRQLITRLVSILAPSSGDIHPAAYATAVAASAVVALATSSMATATIAVTHPYYTATAALAAITAAEKVTIAASQRQATRARGGARSRGILSGGWGGRTGTRSRGAAAMISEPVVEPGGLRRTAGGPPPEATIQPSSKRRRIATTGPTDVPEQKPESAAAVEHEATLPELAASTPASTAPIIAPIAISPYLTTFIVDSLANTISSRYAASSTEHRLHPIMEVSLSLIRALVVAASARIEATTEANSSIMSTRPSLVDAAQAIINLSNPSAIPNPAEELLAAMYIAKSAATAVYVAPAAGTAVASPVGFLRLRPQAGAAAAASATLPHLASGLASSAPIDDSEKKGDDDHDKAKPE